MSDGKETQTDSGREGVRVMKRALLFLLAGCGWSAPESFCVDDYLAEDWLVEVQDGATLWNELGAGVTNECPGDVLVRYGPVYETVDGESVEEEGGPAANAHVQRGRYLIVLDWRRTDWDGPEVQRQVAHEMGHLLGIEEHTPEEGIMNSSPFGNSLTDSDRAAYERRTR